MNTPVVYFDVERHTLVTGQVTHVFHQSSAVVSQFLAARTHLFRVRAQLVRKYWVDFSNPGRIQRFPFDPVERKERHIFFLVSRQIPTKKSSGAHFPVVDAVALGEDTFGVLERSSDQIHGNPSDPFHSGLGRSIWYTHQRIPTVESLGCNFLVVEGANFPRGIHPRSMLTSRGPISHQD